MRKPIEMKHNRLVSVFLVLTLSVSMASGQPASADSVAADRSTQFRPQQLVLPTALIAVGWWGVENGWMHKVRNDVRDGMRDLRGNHYWHADDYLQYAPVGAYLLLDYAGVKARHPLRERLAAGVTATAVYAALTNGMKHTIREKRPDSQSRNSFPSGHTGTAFMGAELVRSEYGTAAGIGAYAFATGIAFLRLYNDRHWLNDVIGGAGVGILSARVAYWLLPVERRWLGWDKRKDGTSVMLVPTYDGAARAAGFALAATF